jgi:hypothetical protein
MKPARSRRNAIPEKSIEEYLVERVRALGGDAPKLDLARQDRNGRTDRLVLFTSDALQRRLADPRLARVFYVECKAAGKPVESHQVREHERLRALGFQVRIVWSHEDVDELLRPFETH